MSELFVTPHGLAYRVLEDTQEKEAGPPEDPHSKRWRSDARHEARLGRRIGLILRGSTWSPKTHIGEGARAKRRKLLTNEDSEDRWIITIDAQSHPTAQSRNPRQHTGAVL